MRILIVSQYFWPETFRVNDICAGLVKRGHLVTVLTGIPNYPEGKFFPGYTLFRNTRQEYQGARIIRVPLIPRGSGGNLRLILNYLSFVICGTLSAPLVCREKYDAIFVFGISPILMAIPAIFLRKIRGIPVVLYVLDLWPESISAVGAIKSPFFLKAVRKIVSFIYRHSDLILVSSPGFSGRIREMGIDGARIKYWPQWAEDQYKIVGADADSPQSREMPSGFRIMFAGNIGAAQDFTTIIGAAERLKDTLDIHWVIVGDGRMKPWVEEQVRARGLEKTVHIIGRRPVETMPDYFALADALLVSLKKEQIFSLTLPAKIQSYMACGRPIVACLDGEGARLIRESGAGISCPAGDPAALAEAIVAMYRSTDAQKKEMGARGRAHFEKHFKRDVLLTELEIMLAEQKK